MSIINAVGHKRVVSLLFHRIMSILWALNHILTWISEVLLVIITECNLIFEDLELYFIF
jgi:hypothetical protein